MIGYLINARWLPTFEFDYGSGCYIASATSYIRGNGYYICIATYTVAPYLLNRCWGYRGKFRGSEYLTARGLHFSTNRDVDRRSRGYGRVVW